MIAGAEHLEQADLPLAITCCDLWGQYRRVMKLAQAKPADKELRQQVVGYFVVFEKACYRLCLDPRGKRTLYGDPVAEEHDPLKEFGIVTA